MNTKEQLEVVAGYAGWKLRQSRIGICEDWWDTGESVSTDVADFNKNHPDCYAALMPVWQKVREELRSLLVRITKAEEPPHLYLLAVRLMEQCKTALTDGTLPDFLLSLANAILWIESTKK